jgi:hypothetical protein
VLVTSSARGFIEWDRSPRDPLRQVLTLDQFHHERAYAARIFQAVDMRDVRMIEGRERLRFACEAGQAIGIAGEGVRQDLQRDVAIQLRVVCAIHLTHAASAESGEDLVRAETFGNLKEHVRASQETDGV